MICGPGGSKSRLAKAAGAEPSGQMREGKVHAVVARSTFVSENAKNTSHSDHFWKLRCRKSARRCGTKHISKSKCTKHHMLAPLLEVQMSLRVAGARDCAPQHFIRRIACHIRLELFLGALLLFNVVPRTIREI